jgi:hypothetical protein
MLLRLVSETQPGSVFGRSATVLKASRSNIKPPTIQGFTENEFLEIVPQ